MKVSIALFAALVSTNAFAAGQLKAACVATHTEHITNSSGETYEADIDETKTVSLKGLPDGSSLAVVKFKTDAITKLAFQLTSKVTPTGHDISISMPLGNEVVTANSSSGEVTLKLEPHFTVTCKLAQ